MSDELVPDPIVKLADGGLTLMARRPESELLIYRTLSPNNKHRKYGHTTPIGWCSQCRMFRGLFYPMGCKAQKRERREQATDSD